MSKPIPPQKAPKKHPGPKPVVGHEACVEEAWRLLSEGVYTFRAIARGVNARTGCKHDHHWVKKALQRHGELVAETLESNAIDCRAKYLQALYARRASAARIAADPSAKDSDRIAALRLMLDCDERVAAAEGIATERKRQEVSGVGDTPVRQHLTITPEQARLLLARERPPDETRDGT